MNKYIILIENMHQIASFGGYISNFLHPLRHPLSKAVYPSNWKNTKLLKKKRNEQEVHAKKQTNNEHIPHRLPLSKTLLCIKVTGNKIIQNYLKRKLF